MRPRLGCRALGHYFTGVHMLAIGGVAKQLGCSIETLRYYEKIGLVPPVHRSEGGHRFYNDSQLKELKFIMSAKKLGFTLEEIAFLIKLGKTSKDCRPVLALVDQQIDIIQEKISQLQRLQVAMHDLATECRNCCAFDPAAKACTIIEALNS